MKLRAPDHISSISVEGQSIDIADDRSVEVSDEHGHHLISHGLEPWSEKQEPELPASVADMNRRQLFDFCKDRGIIVAGNTSTDALRAIALEAEAKAKAAPAS